MKSVNHAYAYLAVDQVAVFARALAILRGDAIKLVNAINRSQFLIAWLASTDLARSLDLAKSTLRDVPEADRVAAGEQLVKLQRIAERVLAIAPHPSEAAILEAGSPHRYPHRRGIPNAWDAEEQAWIAARSVEGPLLIASGPEGLTLSSEGNP